MGKLKGQGYLYGKPESGEQVRQRLSIAGKLAKDGNTEQLQEEPEADASDGSPRAAER
jgi:hypothetical protein